MKANFKTAAYFDSYEDMEQIWNVLSAEVQAEYNNDVEEFFMKVGRPLYEVILDCELDTKTHKVKILSADPSF